MDQHDKQKVIEPGDKNYKDKEHFSNQSPNYNTKGFSRTFNCGCLPLSFGCLGLIIVIIALFHFLSYLISLVF